MGDLAQALLAPTGFVLDEPNLVEAVMRQRSMASKPEIGLRPGRKVCRVGVHESQGQDLWRAAMGRCRLLARLSRRPAATRLVRKRSGGLGRDLGRLHRDTERFQLALSRVRTALATDVMRWGLMRAPASWPGWPERSRLGNTGSGQFGLCTRLPHWAAGRPGARCSPRAGRHGECRPRWCCGGSSAGSAEEQRSCPGGVGGRSPRRAVGPALRAGRCQVVVRVGQEACSAYHPCEVLRSALPNVAFLQTRFGTMVPGIDASNGNPCSGAVVWGIHAERAEGNECGGELVPRDESS